jgi:hypothetical protein
MVSVAVPAAPLVGLTVHQSTARVEVTSAVQDEDVVMDICVLPPSVLNVGEAEEVLISSVPLGVTGVGVGSGSSLPDEHPPARSSMERTANDTIFFILS